MECIYSSLLVIDSLNIHVIYTRVSGQCCQAMQLTETLLIFTFAHRGKNMSVTLTSIRWLNGNL